MPSFFSRKRREANQAPEPENRPEQRHDLHEFLPASARPYETQRLIAAYGTDDDAADGPDEDIEFLASLAAEIERQPFEEPKRLPPAAVETVRAPDDETKLNVFRAVRDEPERVRTSQQLGVADVEMDDLLEDLSTTAAAIRRRKAA